MTRAEREVVVRALEFAAHHSTVNDRAYLLESLGLVDGSSAPLMSLARKLREQPEASVVIAPEAVQIAAQDSGWSALPEALASDLADALTDAHGAFWQSVGEVMIVHGIPGDDLGWTDPLPEAMTRAAASLIGGNVPRVGPLL